MPSSRFYRIRMLMQRIAKFFARPEPEPELPGDPYAYVTAPKRPKPSGRGAAAVAELPKE